MEMGNLTFAGEYEIELGGGVRYRTGSGRPPAPPSAETLIASYRHLYVTGCIELDEFEERVGAVLGVGNPVGTQDSRNGQGLS